MKTFVVRDVLIGAGKPKICASILSSTKEELIADAMALLDMPVDIVEWRADWFKDVLDRQAVLDVLKSLRRTLVNLPLLFSLRTTDEGGKFAMTLDDYRDVNVSAITSGDIDIVDVEIFRGDALAQSIVATAHENNVKVVGSFHDFTKTPNRETITLILQKMQNMDVDLSKIAVMPSSKADVMMLMETTFDIAEHFANRPFVLIGMGSLGVITRVAGGLLGTAITFGAVENASAPGQVQVETLAKVLELLGDGSGASF